MSAEALVRPIAELGRGSRRVAVVLARAARAVPRARPGDCIEQFGRLAVATLPLVALASLFVGLVMALQTSVQLVRVGAGHLVPDVTAVSLVRELAPVFTALLVAGRVGAGLASELGGVVLSGQDRAMRALSLDPDRELLAPRVLACVVGTLVLTAAAMAVGLVGGLAVGPERAGMTTVPYMNRTVAAVEPVDLACGLIKALAFGVLVAGLGCAWGLRAKRDAADLGRHTMGAVVAASLLVLVSDHLLTALVVATLE